MPTNKIYPNFRTFQDQVKQGFWIGLLFAPCLYWAETLLLLWTNGSFIQYHMNPFFTLGRYCFYGALVGMAVSVVASIVKRIVKVTDDLALSFAGTFVTLMFLEVGFYLFDIAYPWGAIEPSLKQQVLAILLVSSVVILVIFYYFVRLIISRIVNSSALSCQKRLFFFFSCQLVLIITSVFCLFWLFNQWERNDREVFLGHKEGMHPPNILLIVLDTVRASALSCYGNELNTTPNIDEIASKGQIYKNAIAPSSWTPPSHASLFTGLYPSAHGTRGLHTVLGENFTVLAEWLERVGYWSLSLYIILSQVP